MFDPTSEIFQVTTIHEALPEGVLMEGRHLSNLHPNEFGATTGSEYRWRYGAEFGTWKPRLRIAVGEAWSLHGGRGTVEAHVDLARAGGGDSTVMSVVSVESGKSAVIEHQVIDPRETDLAAVARALELSDPARASRAEVVAHALMLLDSATTFRDRARTAEQNHGVVMQNLAHALGMSKKVLHPHEDVFKRAAYLLALVAPMEASLQASRAELTQVCEMLRPLLGDLGGDPATWPTTTETMVRRIRQRYEHGCPAELLAKLREALFGIEAFAEPSEVVAAALRIVARAGELEATLARTRAAP